MKHLTHWAGAALLAVLAMFLNPASSFAGDLGGTCCADLEERIAELEATTARKGNRKVTLTITGQVNASLLYVDLDGYSNTKVVNNGNDESRVAFTGNAKVWQGLSAGYVLDLDLRQLGLLDSGVTSHEPRVRQSYWYLKHDLYGTLSVGRVGQATQDFDRITTANTAVAAKPFSLGAVSDEYLTGVDLPFDGHYRDAVRYDSPTLDGFTLSASWGASVDATASDGNGHAWDVGLRFVNEFAGFKVAAGLGYRHDTDFEINVLNVVNLSLPTGDVNTILAAGSVMHSQTGVFLSGNYADQDWKDAGFKLRGWQLTGGLEQKWFSVGKTTAFAEWGKITFDPSGGGSESFDYGGLGLVQAIDAAAMDLYVSGRRIDLGDENATVVTAGARVKF